jgi:ankyrin repeat protein
MTGNTPLHWAAHTANAALVRQLLAGAAGGAGGAGAGAAGAGAAAGAAAPSARVRSLLDMQNLNMCEYSTGSWVVGEETVMPLDKVRACLLGVCGGAACC